MEKLLTAKQLSEILEVKPDTVYDWVSRGLIPYVKLGRIIRFNKNEIFRWVETRTIRPRASAQKKFSARPALRQSEFPLT